VGTEVVAEIVGVFVGQPTVIGEVRGRPVESGIAKAPVPPDRELELGLANLAGDRQADLTVHGGPDKAVYAYPSEHYAAWRGEAIDLGIGGVGENLALAGATEHDVLVGDVWRWGGALVQVSQPRAPCYKLSLHTGRRDVGPRLIDSGRCGWYLRVLEPAAVPARGPVVLHDRTPGSPSVADAFAAMFSLDRDVMDRVLAAPALADQWRTGVAARRDGRR
jgi:MOSC domain-containing protein YiiM